MTLLHCLLFIYTWDQSIMRHMRHETWSWTNLFKMKMRFLFIYTLRREFRTPFCFYCTNKRNCFLLIKNWTKAIVYSRAENQQAKINIDPYSKLATQWYLHKTIERVNACMNTRVSVPHLQNGVFCILFFFLTFLFSPHFFNINKSTIL